MSPGLDHPLVLAVFCAAVSTSAVFAWLTISNLMTLRTVRTREVSWYVAFTALAAITAALLAATFVPTAPTLKVHLFRALWVSTILSTSTWILAVSGFVELRSRILRAMVWLGFAMAAVPAIDLVLSLTTGWSFMFVHVPREPASILIQATGNHYSHAPGADLIGLGFSVLSISAALWLIRHVAAKRPGEWLLMLGIALTAIMLTIEVVLAIAGPGWMVPLAFSANLIEAMRITWSNTRSMGARLADARHREAAQRELIAHQLEQLAVTRQLAHLGSRAAELGHDLRNPLTAVSLSLDFIEDKTRSTITPESEAISEALQLANRSLSDAVALVRRMSASADPAAPLARVEALELSELVRDAKALCEHQFEGLTFHVETSGADGPIDIMGDRVDLTRVLLNLLVNAAQATRELPDPWVRVELAREPAGATVRVVDAGATPAPAVVERMFQRGYSTKEDGHGLGLAICRRLVEAHGGRLELDAQAAHTTFELHLPSRRERPAAASVRAS